MLLMKGAAVFFGKVGKMPMVVISLFLENRFAGRFSMVVWASTTWNIRLGSTHSVAMATKKLMPLNLGLVCLFRYHAMFMLYSV